VSQAHRKRALGRRLNHLIDPSTRPKTGTHARPGVSLRANCANSKLAVVGEEFDWKGTRRPVALPPFVAATYVSIGSTCPTDCFFRDNGCYPQTGYTAWLMKKLDTDSEGLDGRRVIQHEAELLEETMLPLDGARGGRDLRLHVSGDVVEPVSTQRLARGVERWLLQGGGAPWTYTHRWRTHRPSDFGPISALASCETALDVRRAVDEGWVPAVVVPRFPSERAFSMAGHRFVPCPAQTRKVPCVHCRLCFDTDRLRRSGRGIAFEAHGRHAKKIHLPLTPTGNQSGGS